MELRFASANNVEAMRIDTSQNVGIGITSPSSPLHVVGAITGTTNLNLGTKVELQGAGTSTFSAGNTVFGASDVSQNTYLKVLGSGAGYTAAGIKLLTYNGSNRPGGVYSYNHPDTEAWYSGPNYGASYKWGINYKSSIADTGSGLEIVADDAYNLFMIDTAGNVGIGTSAPDQKLHVAGNINIQDGYNLRWNNATQINILGSSTTGLTYTGVKQHFKTYDGSSAYVETLTLHTGGCVGIGKTNNTTEALWITDTASPDADTNLILQQGSGGGGGLWLYNSSAAAAGLFGMNSSSNLQVQNLVQDKDILFSINDNGVQTTAMVIDGDVNRVGIGTTGPTRKLDVRGTTLLSGGTLITGTLETTGKGTIDNELQINGGGDSTNTHFNLSDAGTNIISHASTGATTIRGNGASGDSMFKVESDGDVIHYYNSIFSGSVGVGGLITASGGVTLPATSDNFTMGGHAVSDILIDGDSYPGSSQDNYLITAKYLNTVSGAIVAAGGGGTIGGSITDNQIAFGATTANSIEGSSNLTFDGNHMTLAAGKHIYFNDTDASIHAGADSRLDVKGDSVTFASGSTEVMRVNGGGVGIGTSSPDRKLDVQSTSTAVLVSGAGTGANAVARIVDTVDTTALEVVGQRADGEGPVLRLNHESASADNGDYVGTINFEGYDSGGTRSQYAYIRGRIRDKTAGAEDGSLYFQVAEGNSRTDVMTLSGTKVGIATTAPGAYLDVAADNITALFGSDDGAAGTRTNSTNKVARIGLAHYTNAEEPAALLVPTSTTDDNYINYGGGSSSLNATTIHRWYTAANNITTNGTERMRLNETGLGIGTTNPTKKLHVEGSIAVSGAESAGDSGYGNSFYQYNQSGAQTLRLYSDSNNSAGSKRQHIYATASLNIESTEHMGIGPSTSGEYLHLYAGATAHMYLDAGGSFIFRDKDDSSAIRARLYTATGKFILNDSSAATQIELNPEGVSYVVGKLGVGLGNPQSFSDSFSAQIDTNSGWPIGFTNAAEDVKGAIRTDQGDNYIAFASKSESDIRFFYNDAEANTALIVKGSGTTAGNVGIGTTSPSEKLHVTGNAIIDGHIWQVHYNIMVTQTLT